MTRPLHDTVLSQVWPSDNFIKSFANILHFIVSCFEAAQLKIIHKLYFDNFDNLHCQEDLLLLPLASTSKTVYTTQLAEVLEHSNKDL